MGIDLKKMYAVRCCVLNLWGQVLQAFQKILLIHEHEWRCRFPLIIKRVTPLTLSTWVSLTPVNPGSWGTVIAAFADFVESATEVAVKVTLRLAAGSVTGGV